MKVESDGSPASEFGYCNQVVQVRVVLESWYEIPEVRSSYRPLWRRITFQGV